MPPAEMRLRLFAALAVPVLWNLELYGYLSRGRGPVFAVAVVPLHLIYYFTSGLAFALGHVGHRLGRTPEPSERTVRAARRQPRGRRRRT